MQLQESTVHRESFPLPSWLALVGVLLVVGCTPPPTEPPDVEPPAPRVQSARLAITLPSGAPSSEVTRVTATLTAANLAARSTELSRSGDTWNGVLPDVPEGPARTFSAEAFDSSGLKRFVGRAENVSITAGQELVVAFTLQVTTGNADVGVSLNQRPVLTSLTASPSRVDVGQTTTVSALASDPDGDALSFQWSATGCSGRIEDSTSLSARFTPDALPSGDACGSCRLSFLATDRHGAQAHGSLGLCVGPSPTVSRAPHVVETHASATTVGSGGQHVQLSVRAWDPQGSALSFSWEPLIGQLQGTPTHTVTTSEAVWVVPSCIPQELTSFLRVVVRNAQGQTATASFPLSYDGVPTCGSRWATTGSLARPRQGHSATLLGSGQVLVTGGTDGTQVLASSELYDPTTGAWTQLAPMGTPRVGHTATALDGDRVLVVGGYSSTLVQSLTSAEIHDARTGQWSPAASMDTRRSWHTATRLSWGGVLITGGINGYDQLSNVELYQPASNTWGYQGSLSARRYQHTATRLSDGRVLVTGGKGTGSSTAERFDSMTGKFTSAGTLGTSRSRHTATLLPDGKVLVTGGDTDSGPTSLSELYDPATNTWAPTHFMNEPRAGHTATLLPDGKVLIVGGANVGGTLATAELYDTATGRWSPATRMVHSKEGHTAVLLGSGQLLVTGGSKAGASSAVSELHTP
jgi:hypothetical protein